MRNWRSFAAQGADVALLVRRVREATGAKALQCVGTSATLAGAETGDAQQRENRAIPYVAAYGGLRISEALGITLEGIDWLRREIRLEFGLTETTTLHVSDLKTDAAKATIVLPGWVMEILAEQVRKYPPKPVTLTRPDGETITRQLLFTTLRGPADPPQAVQRPLLEARSQDGEAAGGPSAHAPPAHGWDLRPPSDGQS